MPSITPDEINIFAKYIFAISGIKLGQSKGYLLENRLNPLLKSENFSSYRELHQRAVADSSGRLKKEIVDAISTNETFFFRDNTPFNLLKNKIIPDIIDRRQTAKRKGLIPIRIWSAACSTGQEVYSIAITLLNLLPDRNTYDISILGTDISGKAVAQASYGKYNKFEIERGLSPQLRDRYFYRVGQDWRIKEEIRSLAKFEKFNLMQPFSGIAEQDVIFCRNVAIYFSNDDKINLFKKISRVLKPDGALLIGGSENLSSISNLFSAQTYLRGIFYQLRDFAEGTSQMTKNTVATKPVVRRKTVYDRPQKKTDFAKKILPDSALIAEKRKETEADIIIEVPEVLQVPVGSLREKLAGRPGDEDKKSLLASLQSDKKINSTLVSTHRKASPKPSLLEKIANQNKEKK